MTQKMHMAESALNRLMNFMDDLDAPAVQAQGAALDAALAQPTGELPASPAVADMLALKAVGLEPRY